MTAPAPTVKVYYGKPTLTDVSRVLACLYEKDVEFKLIDMYGGQHINPDLIKLQAHRAPVSGFEDDSTLLFESRAICRHVVDKYADRGNKYLLGRDLLERSSVEQWLKSEEHAFDPPSWALVFHLAFKVDPDYSLITQSERKLSKVLDVYEQRLGQSKYLAGEEFSLADLSHLPNSYYLERSREWGHLFKSRKNVRNWWEEISNRPSWQKVIKKLNDVGLLKDSKMNANANYQFLIHKNLDLHPPAQTATSSDAHSGQTPEQAKQTHQPDLIDQQTASIAESTQLASPGVPSSQKQQEDVQKVGQSGTQPAPADAQSPTQLTMPAPSSSQKQEENIKKTPEMDVADQSIAQETSRQQVIAESSSIQRQSGQQTGQVTKVAQSTAQTASSDAVSGQTSNREGSLDVKTSQKQDQDKQLESPTDSSSQSQQKTAGAQPSKPDAGNKSSQKRGSGEAETTTPQVPQLMDNEESAGQPAARKDVVDDTPKKSQKQDAQLSTKEGNAKPSQKQEQDKRLEGQADSASKSQQKTADAQPSKQPPNAGNKSDQKLGSNEVETSTPQGSQTTNKVDSAGQPAVRKDDKLETSQKQDVQLSTGEGNFDAKPSQKQDQDKPLTGQVGSASQPQEKTVDAQLSKQPPDVGNKSSQKSGSSEVKTSTPQGSQTMGKADYAGQTAGQENAGYDKPRTTQKQDVQPSNKEGSVDAKTSLVKDQDKPLAGQAESASQTQEKTADAQPSVQPPDAGNKSSQNLGSGEVETSTPKGSQPMNKADSAGQQSAQQVARDDKSSNASTSTKPTPMTDLTGTSNSRSDTSEETKK